MSIMSSLGRKNGGEGTNGFQETFAEKSYNCIKARVRRANEAAGYSCWDELHAIWFLFSFGRIAICVKPPPPPTPPTSEWTAARMSGDALIGLFT